MQTNNVESVKNTPLKMHTKNKRQLNDITKFTTKTCINLLIALITL